MSALLQPAPDAATASMRDAFDTLRRGYESERAPSLAVRRDRLDRLQKMLDEAAPAIIEAVSADFGQRPRQVTALTDLLPVAFAIRHARRHLRGWMRTRRAPVSIIYRPGWNRLTRQPLGVVGIVSPWNYPVNLALSPVVGALAAGNRVLIKPSEIGPRFSDLLQKIVAKHFRPDEMAVVTGGPDVGRAFCELPFDHLLFTGSTSVGRQVAVAAAKNLVPVTLELGGKSPAILNADADLDVAVPRLLMGKLLNAGQTCIAPDYALVPAGMEEAFVQAMRRHAQRLYPTIAGNPDYTSIASDRHHARLQQLVDEAREQGARVVPLHDEAPAPAGSRLMAPVLVLGAPERTRLMTEEIFGPVLPVVSYRTVDEAIAYVNDRDRPLAMYWFGKDSRAAKRVMSQVVAGGVTVNDTIWHIGQEDMPFGGVGPSGMGAYHGETGFRAFTKETGVFVQPRLNAIPLLYPPYGGLFDKLLAVLKRIG